MNVLINLEESISLVKLKGTCHVTVRNAFFANYITALLLLKLQDLSGLMIINDHQHAMLTKFSPSMSDLNFWARAMFYSSDPEVKNRMEAGEAAKLSAVSKKIAAARIQKIMKVPLTAPDAVSWVEVVGSTLILRQLFGLKSSYFDHILQTINHWDTSNIGTKQKAINDALMFLMQSDPTSKIIPHLRKLSNTVMTKRVGSVAQRVVSVVKLREDDGGGAPAGGDGGATSTANIASTSGNAIVNPTSGGTNPDIQNMLGGLYRLEKMSPNQVTKKSNFTVRNGKLIKKKTKNFAPKKFKAPEFLKPTKKDTEKSSELKMKEVEDAAE